MRLKFSNPEPTTPRYRVEYRLGAGSWQLFKASRTVEEARAQCEWFFRSNWAQQTYARLTPSARIIDTTTNTEVK